MSRRRNPRLSRAQRILRAQREPGAVQTAKQDRQLARVVRHGGGEPTETCPKCGRGLAISAFPRLQTGQWVVRRGCIECNRQQQDVAA